MLICICIFALLIFNLKKISGNKIAQLLAAMYLAISDEL